MAEASIGGIITAVVTPFRDDEVIDFSAWQRNLGVLSASGVSGILAAGAAGECYALSAEERIVALRFCRQNTPSRIQVYGNVGSGSTRESIRIAQAADAEGIDYAVVIVPPVMRPSAAEWADHLVDICRAVEMPVLAWDSGERAGLSPDAAVLASERCDNFAGVVCATDRLRQWVERGPEHSFAVLGCDDGQVIGAVRLGCVGVVSECANVAPRLFVELLSASSGGRLEDAARLQSLASSLSDEVRLHTYPSLLKEAMNLVGLRGGVCRRPVGPAPATALEQLAACIEVLRAENVLPEVALASTLR